MKIVVFLCNWCSYEASLGAGGKRLACPADVSFVRVMCSGMVNPQAVLSAFSRGADGVLILGCHPGDCHYREGNIHAGRRVALMKKLLSQFGIDPRRMVIDWASASESDRFSKLVNGFYETINDMGGLNAPAQDEVEAFFTGEGKEIQSGLIPDEMAEAAEPVAACKARSGSKGDEVKEKDVFLQQETVPSEKMKG